MDSSINFEPLKIIDMLLSLDIKINNLKSCIQIMNHLNKMGKMNKFQSEKLSNSLKLINEIQSGMI